MSVHGVSLMQLPSRSGYNPASGDYRVDRWLGTPGDVATLAASFRSAGKRYELTPMAGGEQVEISVNYGAEDTQPVDVPLKVVWSLLGSEDFKSVWAAPNVILEMGTIPDIKNRANLKRMIEAFARGEVVYEHEEESQVGENALVLETLQDIAQEYSGGEFSGGAWHGGKISRAFVPAMLEELMNGTETIPIPKFVLERVKVVSSNTTLVADYTHLLECQTTSEIIASENVDPLLIGALPPGIWIKKTPTAKRTSDTTGEIVQQWDHADNAGTLLWKRQT